MELEWYFTEYQGHPAITIGWSSDWDKPECTMDLWYHPKETWVESYYKEFIQITKETENCFLCWNTRNRVFSYLDTTGWLPARITVPVKKPSRGGKDWHWEWHYGKWEKRYGTPQES